MSGTSLDGVDIALIQTDGKRVMGLGPSGYRPYTAEERELLTQALADAAVLDARDSRPGSLGEAEELVTWVHAEALKQFMRQHNLTRETIDIVGFHGQTVIHRPDCGLTVQIGDGAALSRAIGVPVMYDFRAADVASGGQGAPLVPVYHRALVQSHSWNGPVAVVNIGGVANVTYIDGADVLIACDTGPGNALIDDFMFRTLGERFDFEGRTAALGTPDEAWIAQALREPYFTAKPPKSLDRNSFSALAKAGLDDANGAATLTAFTAASIAAIVPLLPKAPTNWIISGGGARNLTLMRMLRERLAPASVQTAPEFGWSSDTMEAQAFGYLAARGLKGLPLSYPATTGVPIPMSGGVLATPN